MVKIRKGKFKDVATDYVDDYRTQTFQCNVSHCTNGRVLHVFDDMTNPANKAKKLINYKTHSQKKTCDLTDLPDQKDAGPTDMDYDVSITQLDEKTPTDFDAQHLFRFKAQKRTKAPPSVGTKEEAASQEKQVKKKHKATVSQQLAMRHGDDTISNATSDESSTDDDDQDDAAQCGSISNGQKTRGGANMAEAYFKSQSARPVTSDHTLASLREQGLLDQHALRSLLSSQPNQCQLDLDSLIEEHRAMFRMWMIQLCLGFNVILYGYGSKKSLIEEFRQSLCSDYTCVVINGFFPSLTAKNILSSVCDDCLDLGDVTGDPEAVCRAIVNHLESKGVDLFIFVHNIDGAMMRQHSVQSLLSWLATSHHVHLVASIDHINAPLMWNQATFTKFNWVWYDATTFLPYLEETSYESSLIVSQSGNLALKSMVNVFKSLTPNAKSIFLLIVNYHLEHCNDQTYIGISFQTLYQTCRERFLVNSDQTLRTQLTEFRDHKLIRSKKNVDGAEYLYLCADTTTLKDFTEQVSDER